MPTRMAEGAEREQARRGVPIIASISGLSCWIRATIEPIGSSTSGSRAPPWPSTQARIRLRPTTTTSPPLVSWGLMELLDRLRAEPSAAAIVLDVDGVLAPSSRVPRTRSCRRRRGRSCATSSSGTTSSRRSAGRTTADATRLIGVPEVAVAGTHGTRARAGRAGVGAGHARRGRRRALASRGQVALRWRSITATRRTSTRRWRSSRRSRRGRAPQASTRFGRKGCEAAAGRGQQKGTAVQRLLARAGLSPGALRRRRHDRPRRVSRRRRARAGRTRRRGLPRGAPRSCVRTDILVAGTPAFLELLKSL